MENGDSAAPESGHIWSVWFPQKNNCKEVAPAKSVLNQKSFQDALPRLGNKINIELRRMLQNGKEPVQDDLPTQKDLLEQLNSLPLERLRDYVDAETETLQGADANLKQKRTKGVHKAASQFQNFAISFDQFLKAYSGVVDIVKSADEQYGGIACATLALLFATVKLKAKDEESIQSAMRQIADRLPDFKVYQRIYPDPSLGKLLAEVYRDIILFARKATVYFQGHGFRRTMLSFGRPLEFQSMENDMRENFSRVRLKCETLLAERVENLSRQNEGLRKDLQRMQEREDSRSVIEMRKLLCLKDYNSERNKTNLQQYREILADTFSFDPHRLKMDLETLKKYESYNEWAVNDSSLLVLFGRNESGVSTEHSWLSSVAVESTETLLNSKCTVAYFLCVGTTTLTEVLSSLIYQILEKNPTVLRRGNNLRNIEAQLSRPESGEARIVALRAALLQLINIHDEPVYFVIDRPELCREGGVAEFLETMLTLVRDTRNKLKIMVVQRSEWWDVEKNAKEIRVQGLSPTMMLKIRMDQYRL